MAQKRMFDKAITNSDNFLELTDACQNLYFHLSMNADDDGFVDNWKSILRMTNHKLSDMQELAKASFIIPFESGVIVIRHWRMNNYLRNDRYKETTHKFEKSLLKLGQNEEYLLDGEDFGIPMVDVDKNSIEENSKDKNNINNIYCVEFEELWKLYPKKVGKQSALKDYIKARKSGITYEEVKEGLNKYLQYCEANKSWYKSRDGSTWFHKQSWNDEREVERKETEEEWEERMEREIKEMEENERKRN